MAEHPRSSFTFTDFKLLLCFTNNQPGLWEGLISGVGALSCFPWIKDSLNRPNCLAQVPTYLPLLSFSSGHPLRPRTHASEAYPSAAASPQFQSTSASHGRISARGCAAHWGCVWPPERAVWHCPPSHQQPSLLGSPHACPAPTPSHVLHTLLLLPQPFLCAHAVILPPRSQTQKPESSVSPCPTSSSSHQNSPPGQLWDFLCWSHQAIPKNSEKWACSKKKVLSHHCSQVSAISHGQQRSMGWLT